MTLQAESLTFHYAASEQPALDAVTLGCDAGMVTWLTGAPGAGTSTLLLVAAGLAPAHTGGTVQGHCRLLGQDPHEPDGRRALRGRVAFVTTDPASQLSGIAGTVEHEVAFAPANLGRPRERILDDTRRAMERCGVAHLAARAPESLSGGEQQRVVLASMLALAPDAWMLDEPGSALDAAGRSMLAQLLSDEAARGATVMVASEDADWMIGWADRVVVLARGRIARSGMPHEILAAPDLSTTGAGSTAIAALALAVGRQAPELMPVRLPVTVDEGLAAWT